MTEYMAASNATSVSVLPRKSGKLPDSLSRELKEKFAYWLVEQSKKHRDERQPLGLFAVEIGVSAQTLTAWKKDSYFLDRFKDALPHSLLMETPSVYAAMIRRANLGDPAMTKLLLQQARVLEADKSESKNLHIVLDASQIPRPSIDTE